MYKLYFSIKFTSDGIPTDLPAKTARHPEPINYNPWAQLEFKHELTGA